MASNPDYKIYVAIHADRIVGSPAKRKSNHALFHPLTKSFTIILVFGFPGLYQLLGIIPLSVGQ
ncbi:hypothetical protein QZJ86_00090 [Methylomonas montana]|uniref:hypothetical protein n=1 Tax=Methylomonas montana TaxID=3058963 RepID=UPI0026589FC8|nr:hypothetical protein [Methylomonas montana]WKJ90566.1 hypothetical protein QZJ86_00090 [Methylomonas montana]